MKRLSLLLSSLFFFVGNVFSQEIVEQYVDSALTNNIVLQQKNISLKQAEYGLKAAKGLFYPKVNLKADYTTAEGGRAEEIPVGDMFNTTFETLNDLLGSDILPHLQNERINFLPHNFYDAKVRVSVPLVNPEMIYNKRIKRNQINLSKDEVDIYKRELIKDVKSAYYEYLQAYEALDIYESSLDLAKEGKRVNEKLLENGKGLPAYILRAESEIESVQSKLIEAEEDAVNAKRYFNFLLNRPLEAEIQEKESLQDSEKEVFQLLEEELNIESREELHSLEEAVTIQKNVLKLDKSEFYPTLNGFVDLGSQEEDWQFNNQSRYYMIGLQLDIPLFAGTVTRNKMKQTELALEEAELDQENLSKKLQLSGEVSRSELRSAYHNYLSAKKQLKAAKSYHRLIQRGYKEGTNSYIETVDARNQLTQAQIGAGVKKYKMLVAKAKLERETAAYNID